MISKGVLGVVVIAVILAAYIGMNPSILERASVTDRNTSLADDNGDPNITKVQAYKGPLDVNNRASDTIETSTVYTDATNYIVNYYKKVNDTPVFIISSASNTAAIDIELADKSIWAEVVIPSGQAFYLDGANIAASHPRVGDPTICDFNNDNVDTYCFPIDVTGYTKDDNNPGFTWFVRLFDEGSITLNSPADSTGLGQGKVSCSVDWEASMDNEGDAEFVTKVVLTLNQTESSDLWFPQDSWLKIDGEKFTFDEDGLNGVDKASTYTYTLKLSNDYLKQWQDINNQGAIPLKYLINGDNEFDFEMRIFTNFDAADEAIEATLAITTENAQGSSTTDTDAVKCLET